ncbi:MAG: hypothetical protein PVI26_06390 [Chitinispirillia bacterium]|jgi:hypothetical protein
MNRKFEDIIKQIERLKNLAETPVRRAKIRGLQKVLENGYPVRVTSKDKKGSKKKTVIKEKLNFTPPAEPKKMTREEMQKFLNLNE